MTNVRILGVLLLLLCIGATPEFRKGFREVPLGVPTLGTAPPDASNIETLDGFGAVRRDGTQINACVSFRNNAPKTASLVHYEFSLVGETGAVVSVIPFDIKGTFSTGVAISTVRSFNDFADYVATNASIAEADHCMMLRPPMASAAILATHLVTYSVTHVEYTDGTSWSGAGALADVPKMLPGAEQGSATSMNEKYYAYPLEKSPPDGSAIEFLRGFGEAGQYGENIDICVAFRNTAPKNAKVINVTYYLVGEQGTPLGEIPFVRKGTFAQGAEIGTYTFINYISQFRSMNGGFYDNCAFHRTKTPPFWNPGLQHITYKIMSVEYDDGTSWSAPAAP